MTLAKFQNFQEISDERGSLVILEGEKNIPFAIQRVYYLSSLKSELARGFHAHLNHIQVAVCISGKCRMVLDDGQSRESLWLDSPSQGIVINNMIWHEMHDFSDDCILMVLADSWYDEDDYIRDYNQFLKEVEYANSPSK